MLLKVYNTKSFPDIDRLNAHLAFYYNTQLTEEDRKAYYTGENLEIIKRIPLDESKELAIVIRKREQAREVELLTITKSQGKFIYSLARQYFLTANENIYNILNAIPIYAVNIKWLREYFRERRPENLDKEEAKRLVSYLSHRLKEWKKRIAQRTRERERKIVETLRKSRGKLIILDMRYKLDRNRIVCIKGRGKERRMVSIELPILAGNVFELRQHDGTLKPTPEAIDKLKEHMEEGEEIRLAYYSPYKQEKIILRIVGTSTTGYILQVEGGRNTGKYNIDSLRRLLYHVLGNCLEGEWSFRFEDYKPKKKLDTALHSMFLLGTEVNVKVVQKEDGYCLKIDKAEFPIKNYRACRTFLSKLAKYNPSIEETILDLHKITGEDLPKIVDKIRATLALKKL